MNVRRSTAGKLSVGHSSLKFPSRTFPPTQTINLAITLTLTLILIYSVVAWRSGSVVGLDQRS